jgi:hypothetical protein
VVFIRGTLVRRDQVAGSVPDICSIRGRKEGEERLHAGINSNRNAIEGSGAGAGAGITSRGEQTLMGKGVRHGGNCREGLYFTKTFIVCKEKGSIMHQRPSDGSAELVAHEWQYRAASQIKVVFGIERGIAMRFK